MEKSGNLKKNSNSINNTKGLLLSEHKKIRLFYVNLIRPYSVRIGEKN